MLCHRVFTIHFYEAQILSKETIVYQGLKKVYKLSPNALAIASPKTFNNTETERHNQIVIFSFISHFIYFVVAILASVVP